MTERALRQSELRLSADYVHYAAQMIMPVRTLRCLWRCTLVSARLDTKQLEYVLVRWLMLGQQVPSRDSKLVPGNRRTHYNTHKLGKQYSK